MTSSSQIILVTYKLYAIEEQRYKSSVKDSNQDILLEIYKYPSDVPLLLDNFSEENPEVPINDTQVNHK